MKKYKIYSGLGGGFGGATYRGTYSFESKEAAWEYAYQEAIQEYSGYEGMHGLVSYDDWLEGYDLEDSEDNWYEFIVDEMESWLDYDVKEVKTTKGDK